MKAKAPIITSSGVIEDLCFFLVTMLPHVSFWCSPCQQVRRPKYTLHYLCNALFALLQITYLIDLHKPITHHMSYAYMWTVKMYCEIDRLRLESEIHFK